MDLPQPVTAELERDLDNLASLNRHFGSHRLIRRFLSRWFEPGATYRVLDLATGAGDIPRLIAQWCESHGITVRIDAVDANASTLALAKTASKAFPNITWHKADALLFDEGHRYDLVCCTLALHHFSEEDAVKLLRRCRELSDQFVLVSDLERSSVTYLGVWLLTALLYREPMTVHDGRLSVRRSFSWQEMQTMAIAAGWDDFTHARFLFCRQAIWIAKRDMAAIPPDPLPAAEGMPCPT